MHKKGLTKLWWTVIVIVAVIILAPVLILGYLGFVPGLSNLFGSNQPTDLGVTYTASDAETMSEKMQTEFVALAPGSSIEESFVFEGEVETNTVFSAAELASLWENRQWVHDPFEQMQVKFNDGGEVEASGKINKDNIMIAAKRFGLEHMLSDDEVMAQIDKIPGKPAFYLRFKGTVTDNNADIDVSEIKVGKLSLPAEDAGGVLEEIANTVMAEIDGMNINSITFDSEGMHYEGTTPEKISYEPK